jgi:DNA helicase-2/ATP-dependent DNA helicase PcrA
VLFRASHHSALLEIELSRCNVPFVKYGGLKFIEAAHVKDVLSILRWAENARDPIASFRTLQLLPGVGPTTARKAMAEVAAAGGDIAALVKFTPPAAAALAWPGLCRLLQQLRKSATSWDGQLGLVRSWYEPLLERLYDYPAARVGDLDQLEQLSANYASRERFLSELTLDPPGKSGREAGVPNLDEDYLVLSTIHSAKGQEWDAVYVMNLVDGCIPSDMATGKPEQIDEERRLLYVAMTRGREHLELIQPMRFFSTHQPRLGTHHIHAPRSRFLPDDILHLFDRRAVSTVTGPDVPEVPQSVALGVGARMRGMWT